MSPVDKTVEGVKCEDLERVVVYNDLERFFQVDAQLPPQEKEELIKFLRRNIDMFAWSAYDEFQSLRYNQKTTTSAFV